MTVSRFREALMAYGRQDPGSALDLVKQAVSDEPDNTVYTAATIYLERVMAGGKSDVYIAPEAFAAFIRGGGNMPLYAHTSAALRRVYEHYDSLSLLDIGAGDGLALLPALTPAIRHVDVLEPALSMLNRASAALQARAVDHRAIHATVQQFMATMTGDWDVIQSTYALQSIHPQERPAVLGWIRRHTGRALIVEFDAPDFGEMYDLERVSYFVERYRRGLAEYAGHGDLVAQGFLMPVFFGGFDPGEARVNWEMPIAEWSRLLREAGFAEVRTEWIYDYWWADAHLIDAQ
jgi:hypothetical protein